MGLAVSVGDRGKSKESEKIDKYLDLTRELKKKLWDMKVKEMPNEVGLLGTVSKT